MQARLKPCAKRENSNHRACTSEGCFFFLHRAQPVSEMEQSGIELHGMSRTAGSAARERDEAKRNRAAWHEPDGGKSSLMAELIVIFPGKPEKHLTVYPLYTLRYPHIQTGCYPAWKQEEIL